MATLSVLAMWAAMFGFALSGLQEHRSQHELQATFREQLATQTAPIGPPIARGLPVASVTIPTLGIADLVVVEGTSSAALEAGPGHRRDTVLPGEVGVSVLMGRGSLFGAPFGRLGSLKVGDPIRVVTGQGAFLFAVTDVRRGGDPLPYPLPDRSARLTLETSVETHGGLLSGRETLYVDATLRSGAEPADAGRPAAVSVSEAPMGADPAALPALVAWLLALGATVVAAAWARTGWGTRQALLTALPLVVATLWGAAAAAALLLPNLL